MNTLKESIERILEIEIIRSHIAEAVRRGELTPAEAEQTEAELMKGE